MMMRLEEGLLPSLLEEETDYEMKRSISKFINCHLFLWNEFQCRKNE
jgi:hypothetical protein